jgi:hypothetical protein
MDWTYSLTKKMARLLKSTRKKSAKLRDELINECGREGTSVHASAYSSLLLKNRTINFARTNNMSTA